MSSKTRKKAQAGQRPGQPQSRQPKPQQAQVQAQDRPQTQAGAAAAERAARHEQRMDRQASARAAGERRRRAKAIRRYAIIGAILVVLVGVFVAMYLNEASKPGQSVSAMAVRNHLNNTEVSSIAYSTDPPTSGPHSQSVPQFKVYTEPITKELTVHGLEDGGVVINYQPDLDKESVDKLAQIATSYIEQSGYMSHVLMAPYPGLSDPIVLTAWRRVDRLPALDEPRIRRFIDEYVGWNHHVGEEGKRVP